LIIIPIKIASLLFFWLLCPYCPLRSLRLCLSMTMK